MQGSQTSISEDRAPYPLALGRVADDQVAVDDVPASAGELLDQFVSQPVVRP